MGPENTGRPAVRHLGIRWCGAALALLLAGLSIGTHVERSRRLQGLQTQAQEAGFADDVLLAADLARESDPHRGALLLARAIVARDLAPESGVPRGSQLHRARILGLEALRAHPAAWQAPMILGAATYLEWSIGQDGRLYRQSDRWQKPLLRSLELSPGRNEPTQFLASAYLELWPALSEERREEARGLVGRALEDPKHFSRLLEPWLSRAEDRHAAFEQIPSDVHAWRTLTRYYSDRKQWRAFVAAYDRGFEVQKDVARRLLEEAQQRQKGRDLRGARHLFLTAAMEAPASRDMETLIQEALNDAPAGPFNPHYSASLHGHLTRALELFLHRSCPLDGTAIARLGLAAGDLPPPEASLTALAAGDLPEAELIARRSEAEPWTPRWSPYRIARARVLLDRGELEEAQRSLHESDPAWRHEPIYWLLKKELARRAGDLQREERAAEELLTLAAESRRPEHWRPSGPRRLQLRWWGGSSDHRIRLELARQPVEGGAVEIRLNGEPVGRWALPVSAPLILPTAARGGEIHLLEIVRLAGGPVSPGRLQVSRAPS